MHTGHDGINCAAMEESKIFKSPPAPSYYEQNTILSLHFGGDADTLKTLPTFRHVPWFPQSWIIRVLSAGLQSAVSGVWRGAVTLITAVSTLQQVCSACSTQLTFQRRGWWQRHVMSFCTRRQKQSWPGAKALRTHAIAEYVTGQMSSRIADPGLSYLLWFGVECGVIICEMRHSRYSITPVTRVTGDWAAPGSPGNIPDNREYFNINIYLHNWI